MRAIAVAGDASVEEALRVVAEQPPMAGRPLVAEVSTGAPYVASDSGGARIAVVDYGCKRSILAAAGGGRRGRDRVPHAVTLRELHTFDGILLSNGPGDPEPLHDEVETIRALLGRVPMLGICLGHQLLALATGHET